MPVSKEIQDAINFEKRKKKGKYPNHIKKQRVGELLIKQTEERINSYYYQANKLTNKVLVKLDLDFEHKELSYNKIELKDKKNENIYIAKVDGTTNKLILESFCYIPKRIEILRDFNGELSIKVPDRSEFSEEEENWDWLCDMTDPLI